MRPDHEREYVEYVRARLPRLHRLAYLLCADAFAADDIVQTTLTALYLNWKRASGADNLVVNALGSLVREGADPVLEVPDGQSGRARDVSDTGLVVGQAFVEKKQSLGDNLGPRVWRC